MKTKDIRDLINFIASSGLGEVKIETEELKLHVKRSGTGKNLLAAQYQEEEEEESEENPPVVYVAPVKQPAPQQVVAAPVAAPVQAAPVVADNSARYVEIPSPMIGTFYRSSGPDAPAFVKVGDTIQKGKTVCIVEAMKLFNEIESEISGTIVKVLVENSSPVEYGQPLFLVDPA